MWGGDLGIHRVVQEGSVAGGADQCMSCKARRFWGGRWANGLEWQAIREQGAGLPVPRPSAGET